jgi:hypothetical protein
VEADRQYGYPQDKKTMYPSSAQSGVEVSTSESTTPQYSSKHKVDKKYRDNDLKKGKDRENEINIQRAIGYDFNFTQ